MIKTLFTQAFLIICFFTSYTISSTAQSDPKNDTSLIADQVEFLGKDSVKFFLTENYWLSPAACAKYYVVAKVNRYFQLEGLVKYYYVSDNKIAGEAHYRDGHLFGLCYSFYPDGDIQSEGFYYDNQRAGEWDYFYDKNRKWKVINFSEKGPLLEEFYKEDGKQMVKDGNGKFENKTSVKHHSEFVDFQNKLRLNSWITSPSEFGNVKNGLMDGKWILRYVFNDQPDGISMVEFFSEGKFIKGIYNSGALRKEYKANPHCTFVAKDKLSHLDYYTIRYSGCDYKNGNLYGHSSVKQVLNLFPEFKEKLTNVLRDYEKQDTGWVCIKYGLTNNGKIKDVRTYSIINDNELMEKVSNIVVGISNKGSNAVVNHDKNEIVEPNFFYVLIENKNFIIPSYALAKSKTPD